MRKRLNQTFYIQVEMDDAFDALSMITEIDYNPAIIEPVDFDPNTSIIELELDDMGLFQNATLTGSLISPGKISILYSTNVPATGNGICFRVKFVGIMPGTTDVTFNVTNSSITDVIGSSPANWVDNLVDVANVPTLRIEII